MSRAKSASTACDLTELLRYRVFVEDQHHDGAAPLLPPPDVHRRDVDVRSAEDPHECGGAGAIGGWPEPRRDPAPFPMLQVRPCDTFSPGSRSRRPPGWRFR